ncbi:hypothetical protein ACFL1G_01820 [Planctomycetota bacterium]
MNRKTIMVTLVVLLVCGAVLLVGFSYDKAAKTCPASQVIQASVYAENGCPAEECQLNCEEKCCQAKKDSGACSLVSDKTCSAAENKTEDCNP